MQLVRSPVDVICNSTSDKKIKCHKQPGIEWSSIFVTLH
jgi:hypothetical protein